MRRVVTVRARRGKAPVLAALTLLVAGILAVSGARASDLFLHDEPEVYAAIDRLSALGYLPGFPANTRPYSIRAIQDATKRAARYEIPAGYDGELLRWLTAYVEPKQMGRVTAGAAHADARFLPPNAEGIPFPKGWSGLGAIAIREQTTPWVNGQIRFTSFFGEGGDNGNRLLDSSLELGVPWFAVQAGKISTWYGPGRHGALLFTNNAPPYLGARLHNPVPVSVPYLGAFGYDFFVARMEKKELFSHSLLAGMRLAARPLRMLEIGLSRALHYGGEGRDDGPSEFFDVFASNDPPGRSNTLAGFDVTLSLPFRVQPVQAYFESALEDSSHVSSIFLPWADRGGHLYGLYFPKILRISRLDLRAEYADTFSGEAKGDHWYDHPSYPHRYRGDVLGHSMGGSARDWFVESRWHLSPGSYVSASFERLLRDGEEDKGERRSIVSAGLVGWLSASWRAEAHASWDRVTDESGVPGRDGTDIAAWVLVSWQTDTLIPSDPGVPGRDYGGYRR